jgi:hypothetical protein
VLSTLPLDPSFSAFPTYPVVLGLKGIIIPPHLSSHSFRLSSTGADQDVVNFTERLGESNTIKDLPKFDPRRLVHASQSIEILKPLPFVSGPGWKLKKRLASLRENSAWLSLSSRRATHKPIHFRVWRNHRDRIPSCRPPRRHLCPSLRAHTFHPFTPPFLRLTYQRSLPTT